MYRRTNWKSGAEGGTLVTDERLNNLEDGVVQALAGVPDVALPDAVMTAVAADTSSAFHASQIATIATQVAESAGLAVELITPNRLAGQKWRSRRSNVLAGAARAHIAFVGDSIAFGAGVSLPKSQHSYPGVLIAALKKAGLFGGGWVIANKDLRANPTWDPRWTFAGTITDQTFGFHISSCFRIASNDVNSYVEFTDTMDSFQILTAQGAGGLYSVSIDGTPAGTVGNGAGVGTIGKVSDTAGIYAPSQEVTNIISAGTLGSHTVRITASATAGQDTFLMAIKPIISGNGKIEVTDASISGKSFQSLFSAAARNDEVNGLYGLPMIDFLKADLLVCALGINDWQANRTAAQGTADLATVIARQTTSGNAPTGAAKANGGCLVVWNPQPNLTILGLSSPDNWATWRAGWRTQSAASGVSLLDLGGHWIDYPTGNTAGLFADGIHPNDTGSLDLMAALDSAIMRDA